jgi:hypothetical protein
MALPSFLVSSRGYGIILWAQGKRWDARVLIPLGLVAATATFGCPSTLDFTWRGSPPWLGFPLGDPPWFRVQVV